MEGTIKAVHSSRVDGSVMGSLFRSVTKPKGKKSILLTKGFISSLNPVPVYLFLPV